MSKEDTLVSLIEEIKTFCHENGLGLFKSDYIDDDTFAITWEGNHRGDIQDFLAAFKASGSQMLHFETSKLERATVVSFEWVYNKASEFMKEELKESMELLRKRVDYLLDMTLLFYYDGARYEFTINADWYDHYDALLDVSEDGQEEEDEDSEGTVQQKPGLTSIEEKIESLAKEIFEKEGYREQQRSIGRFNYVRLHLWNQDEILQQQSFKIAKRAEQLYQEEVQAKIDEQILERLREMKRKNPKLFKSEAAAILEVSMKNQKFNKYWYQLNNNLT